MSRDREKMYKDEFNSRKRKYYKKIPGKTVVIKQISFFFVIFFHNKIDLKSKKILRRLVSMCSFFSAFILVRNEGCISSKPGGTHGWMVASFCHMAELQNTELSHYRFFKDGFRFFYILTSLICIRNALTQA